MTRLIVSLTEAQFVAVMPVLAQVRTESPGWAEVMAAFEAAERVEDGE